MRALDGADEMNSDGQASDIVVWWYVYGSAVIDKSEPASVVTGRVSKPSPCGIGTCHEWHEGSWKSVRSVFDSIST